MKTKTNILKIKEIPSLRKKWSKVVLVGGAFDILHGGHIEHLEKAKSLGKTLIVCIVGDKRVKEKKGPGRPIMPEKERAKIISVLKPVDYVFIYNGRHYDPIVIAKIKPDIIFFNKEDYAKSANFIKTSLKDYTGKIHVNKLEKINNSSSIINKIISE